MITDQHFEKLLHHNRKYRWRHAGVGVAVIGLAIAVVTFLNLMDLSDLGTWDPIIKHVSNLAGGSVGGISFFPIKKILALRDRRSDIFQTRDLWQLEMEQAEPSEENLEKIEAIYWQLCDIRNKP